MAVLPTFDMLLFGGTGDLVTRKLLPALYRRHVAGQVSRESRILGIARGALSRNDYIAQAETACKGFLGAEFDAAARHVQAAGAAGAAGAVNAAASSSGVGIALIGSHKLAQRYAAAAAHFGLPCEVLDPRAVYCAAISQFF